MDPAPLCPPPEQLMAALRGAATSEEQQRVERHLAHCSKCVQRLEELAGATATAASGDPIPPGLREAIAAQDDLKPDPSGKAPAQLRMNLTREQGPGARPGADQPWPGLAPQLSKGPDEAVGSIIDRYRLLEKIGEGGFGTVYVAEQKEPIKRRIALKIIKLGMDTRQVVARFEAERQALAMMDHANIARVFDAGATDTGRPYFVMELVRGIPITNYCDLNQLPTEQRLNLFVQVCQAIQHAHQKGIIHRDIKPSNILVTLLDGVPVPKVIDFGIAKATQGDLTEKTIYTQFQQFIGTPQYMSPEQAEMSGLDIDTRSDIYSLGVLLYELLTGKTPFDAMELREKGLDEMRREIREKEPPKPSTRLSHMGEGELTTVARQRQAEGRKLRNMIRGDLDCIVMKCLEKDRTRRYETANGLAMDIGRHLQNELVVARPPSAGYRFRRMVRRHRVMFAAASAVSVALIGGTVVATIGMLRARHEQSLAQTARGETDAAFQLFRELTQADSRPAAIPQFITDAIARLDAGWLADQPRTAAALRSAMGMKYIDFDPAFAKLQFNKALGVLRRDGQPVGSDAVDALLGLASLDMRARNYETADAKLAEALAALEQDQKRDPSVILQRLQETRKNLNDPEGARKYARMEIDWHIRVLTSALQGRDRNELALAERARLYAVIAQFKEAAADFRRLKELNPRLVRPQIFLGHLELYLGNDEAYRTLARSLFEGLSSVEEPNDQQDIMRLSVLAANPILLPREIPDLLETLAGSDGGPDSGQRPALRALLLYRRGNPRLTRDSLRGAFGPVAELIMAMCLQSLGEPVDARSWYDRALRSAAARWPAPGKDPLDGVPTYLVFEILRREAESMLAAGAAPPAGP